MGRSGANPEGGNLMCSQLILFCTFMVFDGHLCSFVI